MSSINFAYTKYVCEHPADSFLKVCQSDNAFDTKYLEDSAKIQALYSITGILTKNLHSLHNKTAHDINENGSQNSIVNGCMIAAVEIGLLATALTLAPMEVTIRTVIAAVIVPFAFITEKALIACGCDTALLTFIAEQIMVGFFQSAFNFVEVNVSAFYSHLANYATEVNYIGHGNCHVLCKSPIDEERNDDAIHLTREEENADDLLPSCLASTIYSQENPLHIRRSSRWITTDAEEPAKNLLSSSTASAPSVLTRKDKL